MTKKLVHQATHDPLTNLLNRREFERHLEQVIRRQRKSDRNSVLCYIDLDRFKIVNDSCGHAAGDTLLGMVSEAFLAGVRDEDVVEQADAACAAAKENGRNRIYVFDLSDEKVDQRRLDVSWINQLTTAIDEQRLVLFKQPIVPILPNRETGERYEILLRIRDANGELVPPSRFLPSPSAIT